MPNRSALNVPAVVSPVAAGSQVNTAGAANAVAEAAIPRIRPRPAPVRAAGEKYAQRIGLILVIQPLPARSLASMATVSQRAWDSKRFKFESAIVRSPLAMRVAAAWAHAHQRVGPLVPGRARARRRARAGIVTRGRSDVIVLVITCSPRRVSPRHYGGRGAAPRGALTASRWTAQERPVPMHPPQHRRCNIAYRNYLLCYIMRKSALDAA